MGHSLGWSNAGDVTNDLATELSGLVGRSETASDKGCRVLRESEAEDAEASHHGDGADGHVIGHRPENHVRVHSRLQNLQLEASRSRHVQDQNTRMSVV